MQMRTGLLILAALIAAPFPVRAAQVQHLNTQSATATGAGVAGKPTIASFNIPSGKNRVLFVWASFERDHCSAADSASGFCANGNTAGTGLGDNWPEPRAGTPPATTTNNQITASITGPGGTINKQNALVVGGTPSGDLRFINISNSPSGSPAGTAFFSLNSFHIALFENEIQTLLGGAASGTVNIVLPDVVNPTNPGDDAILIASVFQNVEQSVTGMVRNTTGSVQTAAGVDPAGNYTITPAAYDAGQVPDEADDGKLVMGFNATIAGFATPAGHAVLATSATSNAGGTWDTPAGNLNNEPNGTSGAAYFRNGGGTPASSYTLQSAGAAVPTVYGGTSASFLLESDNADVADAPVSYGNPTHTIAGIRLGALVDADAAFLNNATATGDDTNNSDDEDGVTLVPLLPSGETTTVPISIQNANGFLNAWFDWNADGDFADAGEQVATNQPAAVGTTNLAVAVPATAVIGPTFARFRVCTTSGECSTPGSAVASGEVEDYQFTVSRKLTLFKTTLGAFSGPFGFVLTNTTQTTGTVTTTAASTPTQVDGDTGIAGTQVFTISSPTTAVTINENSLPAGWSLTGASCVNATGTTVGSLSGATYTLTAAEITASPAFTCTFTNTAQVDLSITKTNTPLAGPSDQPADTVTSGTATTYTLRVVNAGPGAVSNALVTDTPGAGIACPGALGTTTVTCSATSSPAGATTCPAAGVLTTANLFGAGIAIPSLGVSPTPATPNNFVSLSFTCTVQ